MISANTTEILKTLDKKELKRLGEFIKTPYFNSIEKLFDLYEIIAKGYPDFSPNKLDDSKISRKLYPGKEYSIKTIKNLNSEFGKILRRFLAYEEISGDEDLIDLNLVKSLSKRGSFEISNKIIDEKKEKMEKGHPEDYWYFHKLQIEHCNNLLKENKLNLQEIFDAHYSLCKNLTAHFLTAFSDSVFHILVSLKTQNVGCGDQNVNDFIKLIDSKKLLDHLDKSGYSNPASIKMHYLFLYYFINDFTEKDLNKLKSFLIENVEHFSKLELMTFWNNFTNLIGVKLVPLGHKYSKELFDINEFFCNLKIYPDGSLGEFGVSLLRNVFTCALLVEEYKWAENFLNEYSNYINEKLRENEVNYNMGMLSFKHKEYERSLKYLSRVNFTDIYENVNIRFYMLMNHIELKNYDSALAMINSIKQFYKTSKEIPEFVGCLIKDSLNYFSKIIKCEESGRKLDYTIYKKAIAPGRYYHKKYIKDKMKGMV
jgi:hypothetical protein